MTAYAQLPVAPPPHVAGKAAQPAQPDGPDGPGMGKKDGPKETPRMTRLKSLNFDRRPSSILKAWAPEPKKDKKPEPPKTPDPKTSDPKNPEAKAPDPKAAELEKELAAFQKNVTLGK